MTKLRARRPSPALLVALLALFVALGGTVYAATKINGSAIKRGSVPGNRLEEGSVPGNRLKNLSVTGQQIKDRSLNTKQINASALGGRAYGFVDPQGGITNSKNVVGVATGSTGIYCITLDPSIDASTANVVATIDGVPSSNNGHPSVPLAYSSKLGAALGCQGNAVLVSTYELSDFDGAADVGDSVTPHNEFFSFVVP